MSERIIENYLKLQCKKHGFLCFKFAPCGYNGVPDRIVIGNGLTVFVELKAPGKKPRENQVAMHKLMRRAGAIIFVIDSKAGVNALLSEMMKDIN